MHSEYQRQPARRTESQSSEGICAAPWADLQLAVPNDRSSASIVAFVECVLVELTHEESRAEYVSANVGGVKRTQFIATDTTGETFRVKAMRHRRKGSQNINM